MVGILVALITLVSMQQQTTEKIDPSIQKVTDRTLFYTMDTCVYKYVDQVGKKNAEAVYNLLDKTYIKKNKVTKENVLSTVRQIPFNNGIQVEKMYQKEEKEITTFYIIATLSYKYDNQDELIKETYYMTIKFDPNKMIYSVLPDGYEFPESLKMKE